MTTASSRMRITESSKRPGQTRNSAGRTSSHGSSLVTRLAKSKLSIQQCRRTCPMEEHWLTEHESCKSLVPLWSCFFIGQAQRLLTDEIRLFFLNRSKIIFTNFRVFGPMIRKFIPTIKALWADLTQHIKEEEGHDMVVLEKASQSSHSEDMVTTFKRTKKFVPTRSHPDASDKPPFETVPGLTAAPIDHLRDLFRKFP